MGNRDGIGDSGDESAVPDEGGAALLLALVDDLDAGFTEVFAQYQRIVYVVAQRLARSPAEAEDLAADAFLRAYRALGGYDETRIRALRLRPWLFTILRNVARNRSRDDARRPAPSAVSDPIEQPDPAPSVEQQVEQHDARHQLDQFVRQLPETQRLAVVLRHVVGCSTSEVAAALGCGEGTAKSHVSRGMERLRTLALDPGKAAR